MGRWPSHGGHSGFAGVDWLAVGTAAVAELMHFWRYFLTHPGLATVLALLACTWKMGASRGCGVELRLIICAVPTMAVVTEQLERRCIEEAWASLVLSFTP